MPYFNDEVLKEMINHAEASDDRYGNFASTHEALGVALEEWTELISAIQHNTIESIREEAIDLAAVLFRLAHQCRSNRDFIMRSQK